MKVRTPYNNVASENHSRSDFSRSVLIEPQQSLTVQEILRRSLLGEDIARIRAGRYDSELDDDDYSDLDIDHIESMEDWTEAYNELQSAGKKLTSEDNVGVLPKGQVGDITARSAKGQSPAAGPEDIATQVAGQATQS